MKFLQKLLILFPLITSCLPGPAVADDGVYLLSFGAKDTDNSYSPRIDVGYFPDQLWNKYIKNYQISVQFSNGHAVTGSIHCDGVLALNKSSKKGNNMENLLFDSLDDAKKFESNLIKAAGVDNGLVVDDLFARDYSDKYYVLAVEYIDKTAAMADVIKKGGNTSDTKITPKNGEVKTKAYYLTNKNNRTAEKDGCTF